MQHKKYYTTEEQQYIIANHGKISTTDIAKHLGRDYHLVCRKICDMRLKKQGCETKITQRKPVFPIGTVRTWSNGYKGENHEMIKTETGWKVHTNKPKAQIGEIRLRKNGKKCKPYRAIKTKAGWVRIKEPRAKKPKVPKVKKAEVRQSKRKVITIRSHQKKVITEQKPLKLIPDISGKKLVKIDNKTWVYKQLPL